MPSGGQGTRKESPFGRSDIRDLPNSFGGLRARGYARVSSRYQADLTDPCGNAANAISLPEQIEAIEQYCATKGYAYTGCNWDLNPGTTADRRGFLELCAAATARYFDILVIWRSNRLSRGIRGAEPLCEAWEETCHGFRVESVTDDFDMNMVSAVGWVAGKAAEDIRAHTMQNRLARARRGEAVSGVLPYWIERDPATRRPVLVDENVGAVLRAAEMYLAGETIVSIARWMRSNAPPHPTRRTAWNPRSIQNLLSHSALYCDLWYSRTVTFDERDAATGATVRVTKDKMSLSNPYRQHPTVIPVTPLMHRDARECAACSLFSCVACAHAFTYDDLTKQRKLRTRATVGGSPMFPWPLKGLAWCGVCDTAFSQSTQRHVYHTLKNGGQKKYPLNNPIAVLRCQTQQITNTTGGRCRESGYLRADWVLNAVKGTLIDIVNEPHDVILNLELHAAAVPSIPVAAADTDDLIRRLDAKTREMVALWKDKQSGELDRDAFQVLNASIREEKAALQLERTDLQRTNDRTSAQQQAANEALALIRCLCTGSTELEADSDVVWYELARRLIVRLDVMADGSISYRWRFPWIEVEPGRPVYHQCDAGRWAITTRYVNTAMAAATPKSNTAPRSSRYGYSW